MIIVHAVAKEVYDLSWMLMLKSLGEKHGQHGFAFARSAADPKGARLILQQAVVLQVFEHSLASSCNPFALSIDQALTVEEGSPTNRALRHSVSASSYPAAYLSGALDQHCHVPDSNRTLTNVMHVSKMRSCIPTDSAVLILVAL